LLSYCDLFSELSYGKKIKEEHRQLPEFSEAVKGYRGSYTPLTFGQQNRKKNKTKKSPKFPLSCAAFSEGRNLGASRAVTLAN